MLVCAAAVGQAGVQQPSGRGSTSAEAEALLALKAAALGSLQITLQTNASAGQQGVQGGALLPSWVPGTDPCAAEGPWAGLVCSASSGHVLEISLQGLGPLNGSLPAEGLGSALRYLQVL